MKMDTRNSGAFTHRIHLKSHESVTLCYVVRKDKSSLRRRQHELTLLCTLIFSFYNLSYVHPG